jgi:predicted hotdog family 3-hydroxylacyl-ACP dehydratase
MTYKVEQILPHAGQAILIDNVLSCDEANIAVTISIQPESAFYQTGKGVPAHVGLEYMAQACGAYAGTKALEIGQPVRVGFLLGTRDYKSTQPWYIAGTNLTVTAEQLFQTDEGMGSFFCRILQNDIEIASAHLNVFQPKDATSFIETESVK